MSVPDPSAPPSQTTKPVISDRAALEAAIAGAAGLLLGRVLLGRGAGFAAGTAVIAGRLVADWKKARQLAAAESAPAPATEPAAASVAQEAEITAPEPGPESRSVVSDWGFPQFPEPMDSGPQAEPGEFAIEIAQMPLPVADAEISVPSGHIPLSVPVWPLPTLPVFPDLSDAGSGDLTDPPVELPGENFPELPTFPQIGDTAAPAYTSSENRVERSVDFMDPPDMPQPQAEGGEKSGSAGMPPPPVEAEAAIPAGVADFTWTPPETAASPEVGNLKESTPETGIPSHLRSAGPLRPIPLPAVARPAPKNLLPGLSLTPQPERATLASPPSAGEEPDRFPPAGAVEDGGQRNGLFWLVVICAIVAVLLVSGLLWKYL